MIPSVKTIRIIYRQYVLHQTTLNQSEMSLYIGSTVRVMVKSKVC